MTSLPDMQSGETLEKFIDRYIRTPEAFKTTMNNAVDSIVRYLHRLPNYSVQEVVKSGSLGKGTTIGNSADADLVVFFNGYTSMEELIAAKFEILEDITQYMYRCDNTIFSTCTRTRVTEFHCEFILKHRQTGSTIQIDILPAIDVISKHNGSVDAVYEEMRYKPQRVRRHYSVCFCKKMLEWIRPQPPKVKDLIRLLKYWKQANYLPMRSYCCEILVLFVHEEYLDSSNNINLRDGFIHVLNILIDYPDLHLLIPKQFYYDVIDWICVFPTSEELDDIRPLAKQLKGELERGQKVKFIKESRFKPSEESSEESDEESSRYEACSQTQEKDSSCTIL